jgi:hypothetical protein
MGLLYRLFFQFGTRRRKLFVRLYDRWLKYRQLKLRKRIEKNGESVPMHKCLICKEIVSELDLDGHTHEDVKVVPFETIEDYR